MQTWRRTGVAVGSASCLAAAAVNGMAAPAAAAPTRTGVHLAWIAIVTEPPTGAGRQSANDIRTSRRINSYAVPKLIHEAMAAQSAHVHTVTGATYTSTAFRTSLQAAINKLAGHSTPATVYGTTVTVRNPRLTYRYGVLRVKARGNSA